MVVHVKSLGRALVKSSFSYMHINTPSVSGGPPGVSTPSLSPAAESYHIHTPPPVLDHHVP